MLCVIWKTVPVSPVPNASRRSISVRTMMKDLGQGQEDQAPRVLVKKFSEKSSDFGRLMPGTAADETVETRPWDRGRLGSSFCDFSGAVVDLPGRARRYDGARCGLAEASSEGDVHLGSDRLVALPSAVVVVSAPGREGVEQAINISSWFWRANPVFRQYICVFVNVRCLSHVCLSSANVGDEDQDQWPGLGLS